MIYKKELPKLEFIEHFKYINELSMDKKYKLPYFNHRLRLANLIIDNKVEQVYLSSWHLKNTVKCINNINHSISIIETFNNSYVIQVCSYIEYIPKIRFIEGFTYIPTFEELIKLIECEKGKELEVKEYDKRK